MDLGRIMRLFSLKRRSVPDTFTHQQADLDILNKRLERSKQAHQRSVDEIGETLERLCGKMNGKADDHDA